MKAPQWDSAVSRLFAVSSRGRGESGGMLNIFSNRQVVYKRLRICAAQFGSGRLRPAISRGIGHSAFGCGSGKGSRRLPAAPCPRPPAPGRLRCVVRRARHSDPRMGERGGRRHHGLSFIRRFSLLAKVPAEGLNYVGGAPGFSAFGRCCLASAGSTIKALERRIGLCGGRNPSADSSAGMAVATKAAPNSASSTICRSVFRAIRQARRARC